MEYLLYVEMGVLVGIFVRDKFVPPYKNEGVRHFGTLGYFALGFGVSFGFQAIGTDLVVSWAAAASVCTIGNALTGFLDWLTTRRTNGERDTKFLMAIAVLMGKPINEVEKILKDLGFLKSGKSQGALEDVKKALDAVDSMKEEPPLPAEDIVASAAPTPDPTTLPGK